MTIYSILYFLPLLPILILAWRSRRVAEQTQAALSKVPTPRPANDALTAFLQKEKMVDVKTVKSDNYMQNEYVPNDDKIYLSPDVVGSVDVYSTALALRAGAQAYCAKNKPTLLASIEKAQNAQTILFWADFCLLAFAIMTSSFILSIAGYALLIVVHLVAKYQRARKKEIDRVAVDFLQNSKFLSPELIKECTRALDAELKLA